MKYILILAVCIYGANAAIKCVQGADGTVEGTECAGDLAEATKCSQPKFVEFTGLSAGVEYKCGKCDGETKDITCEECDGSADAACNKPKETAEDFMCHSYSFDAETKLFTAAKDAVACKRLKETAIGCNGPKTGADDKTYTGTGCGPCPKDDTHCEACDTEKCNSAMRVAVLFAPLLAVLVHLL